MSMGKSSENYELCSDNVLLILQKCTVVSHRTVFSSSDEPIMPMIPLGLKETKDIDFRDPFKVSRIDITNF